MSIFDRKYLLGRSLPLPAAGFNFTNSTTLDSRITFSRADTTANASYFDATGVMRYGPTNQFLNSAALTSGYVPVGSAITANASVAPDSTTTAANFILDTSSALHYLSNIPALATNAVYTISYHVKPVVSQRYIQLIMYDQTATANNFSANFDLTTFTIVSQATAGTAINGGATITAVGGGWYRISLTGQPSTAANTGIITRMGLLSASQAGNFTGDGVSGLNVWGAQFERNTAASPFIYTAGAALSGPRFDYGPTGGGGVTNWIRNSVATGAAAGTAPTYWTNGASANGITVTTVGASVDAQGLPAVDINLAGTCTLTTTNSGLGQFEVLQNTPAISGQTWTLACNLQLVSGSLNGLTIGVDVSERTSGGGLVVIHAASTSPTGTMTRYSSTATFSGGVTVAAAGPNLRWNLTNGQTINCTIRVSQPQLEQAASAGTYVPTSGMALNSGATPRGLLIEEARSNLAFPSNAPATLFTASASTLTAAQAYAPDGTLTMARLAEDATTATHYVTKTFTVTASAVYTFSLFAQAQQDTFLQLFYDDGAATNGCYANFNLSTGVISQAVAVIGAGTATAASIQAVGSGMYRCSITGVASSSTTGRCGVVLAQVGNAAFGTSFAGNTANGLLIGHAQFEAGSIPTTYIPAVSASVTRAPDIATMALSPPAAFTVAAEVLVPVVTPAGVIQGFVVVDDGSANNRIPLRISSSTVSTSSVVSGSSTASSGTFNATSSANALLKAAYVSNGSAATLTEATNGTVYAAGAGAQPTGLTTLRLGANTAGGTISYLDGWVRRTRYWPQALTAVQLKQITT